MNLRPLLLTGSRRRRRSITFPLCCGVKFWSVPSMPTIRWHLTAKEKAKIRRMTLKGTRQSVIARTLKLTAPTVSKAQRAMGLPTHLTVPEEKIMELFRKGLGGYKIHRVLKVPVNQIYRVAHENKFRRADGFGYPTNPENEARFIEAVKNREDYVHNLAIKYRIGFVKAGRLARQILGTVRFRPGASKPPLSSNFPQKNNDRKLADGSIKRFGPSKSAQ
jgi:hypothetical protein